MPLREEAERQRAKLGAEAAWLSMATRGRQSLSLGSPKRHHLILPPRELLTNQEVKAIDRMAVDHKDTAQPDHMEGNKQDLEVFRALRHNGP
ncbi:hypothetical protein P7K49_019361, partial [Saguinus oedipus]